MGKLETTARREADWEHYLKSPGLNCNAWPAVTMYDYSFELLPGKQGQGLNHAVESDLLN